MFPVDYLNHTHSAARYFTLSHRAPHIENCTIRSVFWFIYPFFGLASSTISKPQVIVDARNNFKSIKVLTKIKIYIYILLLF